MDDILILAPSRWQLRRAIATMNGVLADLGLEQHPDKTTIGPVARGFDFLGYTCYLFSCWLWLGREDDPKSSGQTASAL